LTAVNVLRGTSNDAVVTKNSKVTKNVISKKPGFSTKKTSSTNLLLHRSSSTNLAPSFNQLSARMSLRSLSRSSANTVSSFDASPPTISEAESRLNKEWQALLSDMTAEAELEADDVEMGDMEVLGGSDVSTANGTLPKPQTAPVQVCQFSKHLVFLLGYMQEF
jgi:hypothetical protein